MLISAEYRALNAQLHDSQPDYGVTSSIWAQQVAQLSEQIKSRDILDYGCGKGMLKHALGWPIREYDPAIPEKSASPQPADFVVCTDVLEHIEPSCLDAVLDDLQMLTKKIAFLNVATRPARKILPDGRNAHLIQEQLPFWLPKFWARFTLLVVRNAPGEFNLIVAAKSWDPWPKNHVS